MTDQAAVGARLARYYDLDLLDDPGDAAMYLALAAAHDGPVLELAAGSGRICVPLAAAGHRVTAVDRDAHMLERARSAWSSTYRAGGGSLELVEHDMTTLDLGGARFGLIIVALNGFLLLDDSSAQQGTLRAIAAHLAPDGRAVFDVWLPTPEDLVLYDGRTVLDWVRRDEEHDEWVAKTSSAHYSPPTSVAEVVVFFDAWRDGDVPHRVMRRDRVRLVTVSELVTMAADAGLVVDLLAGDYDLSELSAASERLVLICRSGAG